MRLAERAVDLLEHLGKHVEAPRERIGIREHHDERARADAEPRIAAGDEHRDKPHHEHDERTRDRAGFHRATHALTVGSLDLLVGLLEDALFVCLAPGCLHRQYISDGVRELAGKAVLCSGGCCIDGENLAVQLEYDGHVCDEHHEEHHNIGGGKWRKHAYGEYGGRCGGQRRVGEVIHK